MCVCEQLAHADFDRRTQQCASFDVPITLSVTDVLRSLVHVYGTRCQYIYASVSLGQFKWLLKTHLFGS